MKKLFAIATFIIFFNSCGGGTIGDAQNFEPNEPPAIVDFTVVSVDGSPTDALKAGMKYTITVKAKDPENKKLKFQFNSDYGYFGNPVNTDDSCSISFVTGSFVRPGLPVTVDVSVIDHRDASAVTNYEIGKGRRGPTVTIKYIGSAYIQKEKNTQISFKANCEGIYQLYCDNGVDESSADLRPALAYFLYRKDENGNFKDIIVDIKGPASTADAKVQLSTLESVNKVWVVFSDGINDPFAALAPVTVDNTPPLIESIDTGGSEGVGLRSPLRLEFDEEIMPSSVSDNSVEVEDGGSFFSVFNASGRCSVEGKIITFVPDGLEYYSKYKVSGRSGIKDLAGNEYVYTDSDSNTFTTVEKGTTPNPVFSEVADIYDNAQTVTISASGPDTKIFYTTAIGSAEADTPTPESDEYAGTAINAEVNTSIKAVAVTRGYKQSSVASVKIKIRTPMPEFQLSTCLSYPVQSFAESTIVYPTGGVNYATIDIANAYPSGTEIKYNQSDSVGNWDNTLSMPVDPKTTSSSDWIQMTKNPGAYRYAVYAKSPNMEPSETVYSKIFRVRGLNLPSSLLSVPVNGYGEAFSWKKVSMDSTGRYIAAITDDSQGFVWISDDYGVTWDGYGSKNNWADIVISEDAKMVAAIAKIGLIFILQDGNIQLTRTSLISLNFTNWESICVSKDGSKFLAAANDTQGHFIYYSSNFAQTWNPVSSGVLGSTGSIPGQHSWSSLAASADFGIAFALPVDGVNSPAIYLGNQNTWFNSGQSNNNWYRAVVSPDGTFIGAVTSANLLHVRSGGVFTSKNPFDGGTSGGFAVDETGDTVVAAKNGGKIYRSTDRAITFSEITSCPTSSWTDVASDYSGENVALAASGDNIWIGNFNGSVETFSNPSQRTWTGVACSSDGQYIAACDGGAGVHGGYIHTSADGGLSWTLHKNLGQKKWKSIDMSNDGRFIAAVSDDEYWFSQNYGLTWAQEMLGQASYVKLVKVSVSGTSDSVNAKAVILTDSAMGYRYIRNRDGDPCIGNGSNAWNGAYVFNDVKVSNDGMSFLLLSENKIVKIIYSQDNSALNGSNIFLQDYTNNLNHWVKFAASDDLSKIYIARYNNAKGGYLIDLFTNFGNQIILNDSNPINAVHFSQMESSADGNILVAVNSHQSGPFIYTSIDGGKYWEKQISSNSVIYNCIASTADGLTIFAGGTKQTGIMMLK